MTKLFTVAMFTLFLVAMPICPALAQSDQTDTTWPDDLEKGLFEVIDSGELKFQRPGREDKLPLRIRSPKPTDAHPGPFPLVIFSHGMGGDLSAFKHLSTYLASHGYVVIHPVHTDSVRLQREQGKSREEIRKMFSQAGTKRVDLRSRIDDCIWNTDALDDIELAGAIAGRIDREHTAMIGHSAGAMTTQALAGLKFFTRLNRQPIQFDDDGRFDAFVVISGQGTTRKSLTEESWASFNRPMLVFTGTEDVISISSETPQSRCHPFEYAPPSDKYLVFIEGATHSSYAGKAAPNANASRIKALTSHATLAFLDLYLKDAEGARVWLRNKDAEKFKGVKAEYRWK